MVSLLAALLGAIGSPASASGVSISGVVTGEGAGPLEGAYVCADDVTFSGTCSDTTGVDGAYSIALADAGSYTLHFYAPSQTDFISESWIDADYYDAVPIDVTGDLLGYDAELAFGTHISGTVTGQSGSGTVPLADVSVNALPSTGEQGSYSSTDASGNYTIWGVPAGSYKVIFEPPADSFYIGEWWNDKTQATADSIAVAGVPQTGLLTTLSLGGAISGNVKGLSNANLSTAIVEVYNTGGSWVDSTATDPDGNYIIGGLPAGSYKLKISGPYETGYLSEWWNDKPTLALSDTVTVSAGAVTTGKNAVLAMGGTVTGNVKGAPNTNLAGAWVYAVDSTGTYHSSQSPTDGSGNYAIVGLPTGSYTLLFQDGVDTNYVDEWWNDKLTQELADYFPVTAGSTVSGRDAVLAVGASISGNVKGGSPAVNLQYAFVDAVGPTGENLGSGYSDASGNFTVDGLPAGSYTLDIYPNYGDNFVEEWWDDKATFDTANFFAVGAGATVTGKNIVLTTGAIISGTLQDAHGANLSGLVNVYTATGTVDSWDNLVTSTYVDGGTYSVPGLAVGSYRVGFTTDASGVSDSGALLPSTPYISEWYNNKYSFASSNTVVLSTPGQTASNINGTLENPRFADVGDPSSPFYTYIEWMGSSGISTGTVQPSGKPLYKPGDAVSRQAMALFMYRMSGETYVPPVTPTFGDVATSSQFYTAVEWMYQRGISTGTAQPSGPPLYKPSDPVSRQAMALFIARYAGANLSTPPTTQRFADVPLSASSAAAINWMYVNGISTGTAQPSGLPLYKPSDPVSRQAMAAFLYRVAHLP